MFHFQDFGGETEKLAGLRAKGTSAAEQRDQMKATLAAANKVESEANKALTGAMEAADAYHKVNYCCQKMKLRVVQTQVILFMTSISEKVESDIQRL